MFSDLFRRGGNPSPLYRISPQEGRIQGSGCCLKELLNREGRNGFAKEAKNFPVDCNFTAT